MAKSRDRPLGLGEDPMSKSLFAHFVVGFTASLYSCVGMATADPYKWCARAHGDDLGGSKNCGFITIGQCHVTISGMGGVCEPDQFYTGPDKDLPKQPAKRQRD